MKILHLISDDESDATKAYIAAVIIALRRQGLDQTVIPPASFAQHRDLEQNGVKILAPQPRSPLAFWPRWRWRRMIAKEQISLIHIWSPALLMQALPRAKRIVWHGRYESADAPRQNGIHIGATPDLARRADKDNPCCIPNFVEGATQPPADRAAFATSRDSKIVLCFSHLQQGKGLDTLIASLRTLPEAVLWLEGEGLLRRELEAMARDKNVIDRIRFLGTRNDTTALLRAADVCVLPSPRDNFAAPIVKAWAAGTPVVACDSLGATALIQNESTGLLVNSQDASSLSVALRRAINDEALRRRLIAQGYTAYVKDHAPESVTRQWMDLYKKTLLDTAT